MLKSPGKDLVEQETLMRQEKEEISEVPGKVDSEKIQSTDGGTALMQEERHLLSCNQQKGREIRSRCRKGDTFDRRKLRGFRSDGSHCLWVVGGKVTR